MTFPGHPGFTEQNPLRQPPLRPGEELAGKYRIDRVIGSGAMGVVLLAWHMELEQQVAIKFLYPELAADLAGTERFRREARAAARIKNEHVARVLDVGALNAQGGPYIVMEYLHGRDLARELGERGALPVSEAVRHLIEACEAVAEAHEHGIVHRDLKPANLFLAERSNGERMIKVLDFGISKVTSSSPERLGITDTAVLMGSPAYMSPEQLESSRSVDGRSDIWSLGVIAYELVMGALPFGGDSVAQLVRAVISGARKPLTERDAGLSELEAIVGRCLRQDRAERFQSVPELRDALARFLRSDAAGADPKEGGTLVEPGATAPEVPPAAAAMPRPGAEGAWGRTHGGRGSSWQRHGVVVGGLVAVLAAGGFWLLRQGQDTSVAGPRELAPGAGPDPAHARPETVAAPLVPRAPVVMPIAEAPAENVSGAAAPSEPPAPPPKVEIAAPPPKAGLAAPPPSAPVVTPPSDSAATRAAAPGAGGAALGAVAAGTGAARSAGGAGGASGSAPSAAGTVVAAGASPAAASSAGGAGTVTNGSSDPERSPAPEGAASVAPRDGHFEIPEFGGRK